MVFSLMMVNYKLGKMEYQPRGWRHWIGCSRLLTQSQILNLENSAWAKPEAGLKCLQQCARCYKLSAFVKLSLTERTIYLQLNDAAKQDAELLDDQYLIGEDEFKCHKMFAERFRYRSDPSVGDSITPRTCSPTLASSPPVLSGPDSPLRSVQLRFYFAS